jgi:hypothetical protein
MQNQLPAQCTHLRGSQRPKKATRSFPGNRQASLCLRRGPHNQVRLEVFLHLLVAKQATNNNNNPWTSVTCGLNPS